MVDEKESKRALCIWNEAKNNLSEYQGDRKLRIITRLKTIFRKGYGIGA